MQCLHVLYIVVLFFSVLLVIETHGTDCASNSEAGPNTNCFKTVTNFMNLFIDRHSTFCVFTKYGSPSWLSSTIGCEGEQKVKLGFHRQ